MRNIWKKTLAYFGFMDDDEMYEEFDDMAEDEGFDYDDIYSKRSIKKIKRVPDRSAFEPSEEVMSPQLKSISTPKSRVHVIEPKSFNDAQNIADKFKASIPVIMNLQMVDQDLSKRLVDFASGLSYALNGGMQKVAEKVFLLTPANVQVSAEEKRVLREKGFFNQLGK
ncbi:cell division protein SepF [Candidatus Oleimmundimicrobium sp.]|uniref:cell division protein SepF n=1 Tax=Candidatus Oleimmundimicrobium sp. TaxID=3060597 RepID=UPI00271AA39B|nr:cell division protein SepF [Candidatus Oleimmundimicrobium sp.]MDO8885516.1 cell division protein SepF [Candidatus Oleimmundimicrobium sp.]